LLDSEVIAGFLVDQERTPPAAGPGAERGG